MRIVSLLPSATEIICTLGLEDQLVGVTHECDYPASVRDLPKVTYTRIPEDASSSEIDQLVRDRLQHELALYTLNRELLEELRPDLIVTQKLCEVCAVAESEVETVARELSSQPQLVNLEPQTLDEVIACLRDVAAATDIEQQTIASELQSRVDAVAQRSAAIEIKPRVALLEWLDPPFSSGHWTPELVQLAGGMEMLGKMGQPSRSLSWEEVVAAEPEVIVIACCGFDIPRTLQDIPLLTAVEGWHSIPAVRHGEVFVVDGSQYFSRPGPRLVDSLELLAHVLHPDNHPRPAGLPDAHVVEEADYLANAS